MVQRRWLVAGLLCLSTAVLAGCTGSRAAVPPARPTPSPTPIATASPTSTLLKLQPLGTFPSPVWVGTAPGDTEHLYLAQRNGVVLQLSPEGVREGVVLDLSKLVSHGSERGLLSIAFDPGFHRNGRMYVDYTDSDGSTRVVAYTLVNDVAADPQALMTVAHPYANNNGGLLLFDRTGMLLVGTGDGGNAGDPQNRAQDLGSMLGKILRIDPATGGPAAGNPYPANRFVWALGLRNPAHGSFDAQGTLFLGDPGQTKLEELDVVPPDKQRGANYGWSAYEGDRVFKNEPITPGGPFVSPALTYLHDTGGCSVIAGYVYEGHAIPALRGAFLYGDFCAGRLLAVRRVGSALGTPEDLETRAEGLQAFGTDLDGEPLVLTVDTLARLVPGA